MTRSPSKPTISVVIPVYNGGANFQKCLASVIRCTPKPEEVIVVADGDSDGSWRMAEEMGITVLRIPVAGGPAQARNMGARMANGDILLFIDADVVIPPNAIGLVASAFQDDHELAAIFGSYDDAPAEGNLISQYRNLFHHYTHQISKRIASTFWAGCGAVRRDIFLQMDGFNAKAYPCPSIEDIDLGYRMKRAGYGIRLVKEIQVKHLKKWEFISLLKTDFFCRALPWARLLLRDKENRFINDLNLKISSRICVGSVHILVICLVSAAIINSWLLVPSAIFMLLLIILNRNLYCFYIRKRGVGFALKTLPLHWLYFYYCGVAFAIAYACHLFSGLSSKKHSGEGYTDIELNNTSNHQ